MQQALSNPWVIGIVTGTVSSVIGGAVLMYVTGGHRTPESVTNRHMLNLKIGLVLLATLGTSLPVCALWVWVSSHALPAMRRLGLPLPHKSVRACVTVPGQPSRLPRRCEPGRSATGIATVGGGRGSLGSSSPLRPATLHP